MKVCLYTEGEKLFSKSGLGKAIRHQEKALESVGVSYTTNIKDDYYVLHVNFYGPNSFALAKMAKKHGKKIVYHAHSTEEDFKNGFIFCKQISPAFKKWLIKCYSLGDVIITPTPYSKRLLEGYGIKKKIYAISNGIELDKFKCDKSQRKTFRKRYNFKEDDKVIIGIGLYIERKGIVDFVELAKRLKDYKFIWFGYLNKFLTTSYILKCIKHKPDNVILPGYIKGNVIKGALYYANCMFFPTNEETEGIVALEALATKLTLVTRDIGVYKGWLQNGVNCFKGKNNEEFIDYIKKSIETDCSSIHEEGYKVVENRTLDKVGLQLKNEYELLLKK